MFYNVVYPKERTFSIEITGHAIFGDSEGTGGLGFNQALPMFLLFVFMIFGSLFAPIFKPIIKMITSPVIDEDIKEGLDKYFSALPQKEKEVWMKEEEYNRNTLNFKALTDESYAALQKAKPGTKLIQNVHSYEVLANPMY